MSRQDDIKKLIIQYDRRLQGLKKKQAQYGLETPVSILTEIEDIETEISKLQKELEQLKNNNRGLVKKHTAAKQTLKQVFFWLGIFLGILVGILFLFYTQIRNLFIINNPLFRPTPTLVSSVVWGGVKWSHNPSLPSPESFQGDLNYTQDNYPDNNWATGIKLSITASQILIIHGSAARLLDAPRIGLIGSPTNCFLMMTHGPFNSTIDLQTAAVEIHNVDATANTLRWAAVKVEDMKAAFPKACRQGVDIWIGK